MLPDIDVENVYIYIADDVREDFAPVEVLNRGLRFKAIAGGIHSPTSISTIVSGTYLPQHQVGRFQNTLPDDVPNIIKRDDVNTCFSNSMYSRLGLDPSTGMIAQTLDVDVDPVDRIDEIEPPFAFVERAIGGHAPYVERSGPEVGAKYLRERGDAPRHVFPKEYAMGVDDDTEWFLSQLKRLEARDLLDDTLVIYVSDHGEVLGENGMMTHGPPIHPAHARVPAVFIHPDLPSGQEVDGVLRHADILTTVSSLLDWEWDTPIQPSGIDLTSNDTASHGCTFYAAVHSTPLGEKEFRMNSAWNREGGYVFLETDPIEQALLAGYHFLEAPWAGYARRHPIEHLVFKLRQTRCHGAPGFSEAEAKKIIRETRELEASEGSDRTNEIPKERLEQLGYIE